MTEEPTPKQGRIAERFEIETEIHRGGMARVYRARDTQNGQVVALKRPLNDDSGDLLRFNQEGDILSELTHPAIVLHVAHGGSGFEDAYIATEWLEGETLLERLRRDRLTIAESVAVARRAAEALGCAHRARVIHRDVKPANLMLCAGGQGTLKLLDFGIARREQGAGLNTHVTFNGGTWSYMSPEQAMGAAELGARTDVFSLGCVLFECLSGSAAFPSERSAALVAKIWNEAPTLASQWSGVPPKLLALLAKMMAKDPTARPRDGVTLATELASLGKMPDQKAEPKL
ncbi:MAG TPA: serine/threonine-protein kinase [Polyangiaceae bacterium]|nr:serine/threonine-protein kinase [Polyangiaceae bacterium]